MTWKLGEAFKWSPPDSGVLFVVNLGSKFEMPNGLSLNPQNLARAQGVKAIFAINDFQVVTSAPVVLARRQISVGLGILSDRTSRGFYRKGMAL